MDFILDQRLEKDSIAVLSQSEFEIRLMNDARYLWLIIVPTQPSLMEIFDVSEEEGSFLWKNIHLIAQKLKVFSGADKINIGTIGNIVSQLHIHIVARHVNDFAWPKPVWGNGDAVFYTEEKLETLVAELRALLDNKA